jgi:hypothetical protein
MSLPPVLLNMLEQSHRMQLIFRDARLPQTQQQCVVVGPLSSSPERPRPDFPSRKAIPDRVAWTKLGGVAAAQLNSAAVRLDGGFEALAAGDFSLRFADRAIAASSDRFSCTRRSASSCSVGGY